MTKKTKIQDNEGIVFVVSLGCPKNLVDTEVMTGTLVTNGFLLSADPEQANVYLINTCAFIPPARDEAKAALEEAQVWKAEAPEQRTIIASGCLIQWDKSGDFRKKFPLIDLWLGIDEVPNIAKRIKEIKSTKESSKNCIRQENPSFIYDEKLPRLQLTLPHIAYLKIADGCDNRCSYCAIPDIRGKMRSRSIKSVLAEAEIALANGASELLVMAQDITTFGNDRSDNENLSKLLLEMDKLRGKFWIRLLYAHPAHFSQQLIEIIATAKHILPYVDMPMQHISQKLLTNMNRYVSEEETRDLLKRMRKAIPNLALRTTFISGLPGESDEDFKKLKDFVIEQEFERLGVFCYSPEAGTPAASFENQVPQTIAEKRAAELMEIQAKISLKKNKLLVGKEFDVIVDFIEEFGAVGRTYMDAPEIDNLVVLKNICDLVPGQIYKTIIMDADTYELEARLKI